MSEKIIFNLLISKKQDYIYVCVRVKESNFITNLAGGFKNYLKRLCTHFYRTQLYMFICMLRFQFLQLHVEHLLLQKMSI
jgi:hypothetical protein